MARQGREVRKFNDELALVEVSLRFEQTDAGRKARPEQRQHALDETRHRLSSATRAAWDAGYGNEVVKELEAAQTRLTDLADANSPWVGLVAELRSEMVAWPPPADDMAATVAPGAGIPKWLTVAAIVGVAVVVVGVALALRPSNSSSVDERDATVESESPGLDGDDGDLDGTSVETERTAVSPATLSTTSIILSVDGASADQMDQIASVLADALPELGEVQVTPDGRLEATVSDLTKSESDQLVESLRDGLSYGVQLRGVLADDSCDSIDDVRGEALLASARDGSSLCLGDARGDARVFVAGSAEVGQDPAVGSSSVTVEIRPGEGQATFNLVALECFSRSPTCPTGRLALVAADEVVVALQVNAPEFGEELLISGDFTAEEAEALAVSLNAAAAELRFDVDQVSFIAE